MRRKQKIKQYARKQLDYQLKVYNDEKKRLLFQGNVERKRVINLVRLILFLIAKKIVHINALRGA